MAKGANKKRKKEQDQIVTAQVVGLGIGVVGFIVCLVLLFYIVGTNGMAEIQSLIQ